MFTLARIIGQSNHCFVLLLDSSKTSKKKPDYLKNEHFSKSYSEMRVKNCQKNKKIKK